VTQNTNARLPLFLLIAVGVVMVWSMVGPHDWFTWFLEVAPVLIAAPLLVWTYPRFRFTPLVYVLIALHACILIAGGHYTYAEVPLGFWFSDLLGLHRNHYDRLGHLAQGFVPAILTREILLRTTRLGRGKMLVFLCISVSMAISAWYELIEWGTAVATGTAAEAFLGTQGDPWDTQEDMAMAFLGSLLALATLSRWHDRQLEKAVRHG
jgi:putative membrane protein